MRGFDAIVVGAGPAGTSAAALLARQGLEVALLDRASFPRAKACGEFVNPGACRLIESVFGLSGEDFVAAAGAFVEEVWLHLARGADLRVPLEPTRTDFGVSIPRLSLDDLLVRGCRETGVHVFEGHNVRGSTASGDGVQVFGDGFKMSAKILLAADGSHSVLARQAGLVLREPRFESIGIVAHFEKVASSGGRPNVWMFPSSGDGMMFGLSRQGGSTAVLSASIPKLLGRELAQDSAEFVRNWLRRHGALQIELGPDARLTDVRTTTCFGHRLKRPFAAGTLFLGDAARFVDPFTGEGIHHAVESAFLAAEVAGHAIRFGDLSNRSLSRYEMLRGELSKRYSLCKLVRVVCASPRLTELFGAKLNRNPFLAETLIATLSDLRPARTVLSAPFLLRALAA